MFFLRGTIKFNARKNLAENTRSIEQFFFLIISQKKKEKNYSIPRNVKFVAPSFCFEMFFFFLFLPFVNVSHSLPAKFVCNRNEDTSISFSLQSCETHSAGLMEIIKFSSV